MFKETKYVKSRWVIMRTFNKRKDKKVDFSRRKIVSFLILTSFVSTGLFQIAKRSKKESDSEEFVLVNGWVLKTKDLNVI